MPEMVFKHTFSHKGLYLDLYKLNQELILINISEMEIKSPDKNFSCIKKLLNFDQKGSCRNFKTKEAPEQFKTEIKELKAYLNGNLKIFTVKYNLIGTPFQKNVWNALKRIPYGKTRSYGDIGREIKKPGACRATGAACGKNHLPLIIPCHRVIRKNGNTGGFSCGTSIKKMLLQLEKNQI